MLTAVGSSTVVSAWVVERKDGPFQCAECNGDVILKKGRIKVHHFAHRPPVSCEYGLGESEEHHRCKFEIFRALRDNPKVKHLALEQAITRRVRPDIRCVIEDHKVCIEVQRSSLTIDELERRTLQYHRMGIYVLWICPSGVPIGERFSPKAWQKYLHSLYFGRVYFWAGKGELITPYHFSEHMLYVEEREWYSEWGEHQSAGGYHKHSKRYRTPERGPKLPLSEFTARRREKWEDVPAAHLWLDREEAWW